jgi:hypothetical protein
MLADPTYGTSVSATAITAAALAGAGVGLLGFAATGRGLTNSTYRYNISSSHFIDMFVGRQVSKRARFTIRLTETELVADPIEPAKNQVKTSTAYIVIDRSLLGAGSNEVQMNNILAHFLIKPVDANSFASSVLNGHT